MARAASYAEQLFGEGPSGEGNDVPASPLSSNAFLPRSTRTNLTQSIRIGSSSPRAANIFLPGAHRADSIEAMLAAIPSRFSIEKSLSLDSPTSSRGSSSHKFAPPDAIPSSSSANPQVSLGTAAIPSRRSRDVPGLQPGVMPVGKTPTAAPGSGDMPRTFSGKVRKLKQHRRASASRLRPPGPTPATPLTAPPFVVVDPTVQATSLPIHTSHQESAGRQPASNPAQLAQHTKHSQQAQVMQAQAAGQPLTVQQPGFSHRVQPAQQLQGQPQQVPYQSSGHGVLPQHAQQALQFQHQQPTLQPSHSLSAAQQHSESGRQLPEQLPGQQSEGQLPEQLPGQQQQQARVSRRRQPTADAAGLALQGRAAQEGTEQTRMTQSGPLQQAPSGPTLIPVPELFEAYQVRNRGRGTGTLDRRLASLDRMFQKLPPGENRRRRRLQAVAQSAPALPGTLQCQGSFVLTPGSAALPRELSLNPQQPFSDPKTSNPIPIQIRLTPEPSEPAAPSHRGSKYFSHSGLCPTALPSGGSQNAADLCCQQSSDDSPADFEFARNPATAHVRTAKLSQPAQLGSQIASPAANLHRVPATVQIDLPGPIPSVSVSPPPTSAPSRAMGLAQGRPVRNSSEPALMRNPRTSIEDLSQMHSCLNQLEQQLGDMPRPVSRGAKGKSSTTEAADVRHIHRQQPLHMHVQQPGDTALGQRTIGHPGNDALSFLRPPMQHVVPSSQKSQNSSSAVGLAAEEKEPSEAQEEGQDHTSRPSSAGSVASQPQFAVLKARVGARRQAK